MSEKLLAELKAVTAQRNMLLAACRRALDAEEDEPGTGRSINILHIAIDEAEKAGKETP